MIKHFVPERDQFNNFESDQRAVLRHQMVEEGIRQAKQNANQAYWSFWIATVMSTASAIIGLAGAGFLLFGNASEGTVTTAVSLASGVYSYQLSKEAADRQKQANDRLAQLFQELQDDEE